MMGQAVGRYSKKWGCAIMATLADEA